MNVKRNSIAYLKRNIESLKLEEERLSILTFASPHDIKDLEARLNGIRHRLHELTGQLSATETKP